MKIQGNPLIFIIEDDRVWQTIIARHLHELDYKNLESYTSGQEAINNLYKIPSIVFLDYHLEDMNGIAILKEIKSTNPDTYVIMFSGQDSVDVAIDSMKYGAIDYLVKSSTGESNIKEIMKKLEDIHEMMEQSHQSDFLKRIKSIVKGKS